MGVKILPEVAKLGVVAGTAMVLYWSRKFKSFWQWFGQPKGVRE